MGLGSDYFNNDKFVLVGFATGELIMSVIIGRMKNRIHNELNSQQLMIIGMTGTGKSTTGLEFCCIMDPEFEKNPEKRIVFTPEKFLELVNSDLPAGSAILCDEIGSWLSSRDWYSIQNKLMSIVLETYRFKQLFVIWTVPNIRMIDVNLRDLCHATIETLAIDRKNNVCKCKFKYRQVNPMTGKSYDKFPVIRNKKNELVTVTRINVHRPPKRVEDIYLDMKRKHLNKVYKEIEGAMKRLKFQPKRKSRKSKKNMILKDLKKGMKVSDIARKRRTAQSYVREVRNRYYQRDL